VWDLAAALEAASGADASSPAQMVVMAAVAAHDKDINAVAVSPNDALVVTASQDRTAKVAHMLCYHSFLVLTSE
jgi:U3 small nucleolar RNA-associated protein 13